MSELGSRRPDLPFDATLTALSNTASAIYGHQEFVVTREERLSFTEVLNAARLVARQLVPLGVSKGTRLGLLATYGADWIVTFLAATRVGAIVTPIATTYAPAELRRALRFADIDTLVVSEAMFGRSVTEMVAEAVPEVATAPGSTLYLEPPAPPCLRHVAVLGTSDRSWATLISRRPAPHGAGTPPMITEAALAGVEASVTPSDLALVILTSGSTADPKGVQHTHGAIVRKTSLGATATGFPDGPGQRVLAGLPFYWIGGIQTVCGALHSGAALICQERFDAADAIDLAVQERLTHLSIWPTLKQRIQSHPAFADAGITASFLGGPGTTDRSPAGAVRTTLGMTETLGPHADTPFLEHRVIDPETGEVMQPGEVGEICVRGFSVMAGLYGREREDVFEPDGFYRTRDLGHVDHGAVWFAGRSSEMIKSNGANVAPAEVESALLALPGVKVAAVVGLPDPDRGEGVYALLVPEHGALLDTAEISRRLRHELSAYKVPQRYVIVEESEVPLTATNKADKRRLRELVASRAGVAL